MGARITRPLEAFPDEPGYHVLTVLLCPVNTFVLMSFVNAVFLLYQYLHVTGAQFGQPIAGQREVCAVSRTNNNNMWKAMEGFFIKPVEK